MNSKIAQKKSKTAVDKDENANHRLTSQFTRSSPKKVVTFDYMTTQERQQKRDSNQKAHDDDNKHNAPKHSGPALAGHVNVLFCCDDDDDDDDDIGHDVTPRLRVEYRREIGGRSYGPGQLQDATDVKVMNNSCLLVTDLVNSRLLLFNDHGDVIRTFQSDDIKEPWASAITPDGNVAVTSRKNKKVVFLDGDGNTTDTLGEGYFSCPCGLALTSDGYVIVTDFDTSKVTVFNSAGTFVGHLGGGGVTFHQPRYVTVSRQGDVIVSDSGNHRLVVFSKDWKFVRTIGSFGRQDGCLKFPHAVCTDDLGNILVSDRYNDRVSAFTRRGDFVRHLVTSAHKLRHPQGLALSPGMGLHVSHGGLKAHQVMGLTIKVRDVS